MKIFFNRYIFRHLEKWKEKDRRKPLVLRGARQVGKTTIVKQFAKTYQHSIFLNLEKPSDHHIFEANHDVSSIVETLFISNSIDSGSIDNTLLFIDEIQESPKAIHLLRYFYEDMPQLHVISTGLLLEFVNKNIKSYPVGRVEYLYIHPLNFSEYLDAIGKSMAKEYLEKIPVKENVHQVLIGLFNRNAIVGGMSEVISVYKGHL